MHEPAMDAANGLSGPLCTQKILIVEDEFLQADLHCILIQEAGGIVVGPCATVETSIAAISLERPTAAIVDLRLVDGRIAYDVLDTLLGSGIPLIVVTGYDCSALPMAYKSLHCLSKPASGERVLDTLRRAIAGECARQEGSELLWDGEPTPI